MLSISRRCRETLPATVIGLCLLAVAAVAAPASSAAADTTARHVMFTISSPLVTESSSLVVSTVHPGLVYTMNDSGDGPVIYVLSATTGQLVGRTTLRGVIADDFEDMAGGRNGTLVMGDTGDNNKDRSGVRIYRIPQPGRGRHWQTPVTVRLTYPDGPRDAESILYDSARGRVFIVSKAYRGAKIYHTPARIFQRHSAVLVAGRTAPVVATDATFIRADHFAVIRTYFGAYVYTYPGWKRVSAFDLPSQPQGESVAAPPGGTNIWIGSEGVRSKVLRVHLPAWSSASAPASSATAAPTNVTTTTETETVVPAHNERLRSLAWVVLIGAGAALLVVIALGLVLHQRHRRLSV